jgi:hypothetical protein
MWVLLVVACRRPEPDIVPERAPAATSSTGDAAVEASATSADDASGDAPADACERTETWEARVAVRKTWHAGMKMMLPGPLELLVPGHGIRHTLFEDCGMTGGGCGDCAKPYDPMMISCDLTPTHAQVHIGIDDVGETFVNVVQRGNTIVAEWTEGGMVGLGTPPTATHSVKVVAALPCSVTVRFVR